MTLPTAAYDAHQAPTPPPPRPPRPAKIPGYLFTAANSAESAQWLQQQVFYTHDRALMLSVRDKQPIFLLDAEAQQLHGVFQRTMDDQVLQQDLTQVPGPQGFKVHVVPLYEFPVSVDLDSVDDLLVCSRQQTGSNSSNGSPGTQPTSSSSIFEPVLGSFQHGYLWEAFMKKAKKAQHSAMECIEETEQQLQGLCMPPPPPPRPAASVANSFC